LVRVYNLALCGYKLFILWFVLCRLILRIILSCYFTFLSLPYRLFFYASIFFFFFSIPFFFLSQKTLQEEDHETQTKEEGHGSPPRGRVQGFSAPPPFFFPWDPPPEEISFFFFFALVFFIVFLFSPKNMICSFFLLSGIILIIPKGSRQIPHKLQELLLNRRTPPVNLCPQFKIALDTLIFRLLAYKFL